MEQWLICIIISLFLLFINLFRCFNRFSLQVRWKILPAIKGGELCIVYLQFVIIYVLYFYLLDFVCYMNFCESFPLIYYNSSDYQTYSKVKVHKTASLGDTSHLKSAGRVLFLILDCLYFRILLKKMSFSIQNLVISF